MNTLKEFYVGESDNTRETWGYRKNGIVVRLGSKHYAEELCKKYKVDCIKLDDLSDEEKKDQERSAGQERSGLKENALSFSSFLMSSSC